MQERVVFIGKYPYVKQLSIIQGYACRLCFIELGLPVPPSGIESGEGKEKGRKEKERKG